MLLSPIYGFLLNPEVGMTREGGSRGLFPNFAKMIKKQSSKTR